MGSPLPALHDGEATIDDVLDSVFASMLKRAGTTHNRPGPREGNVDATASSASPTAVATYTLLLRKIARMKALEVNDEGFFPVEDGEYVTYTVRRGGKDIEEKIKMVEVLKYSGVTSLKPAYRVEPSWFRFEPVRLHRWLIESKKGE